jgi:hypothetical protein
MSEESNRRLINFRSWNQKQSTILSPEETIERRNETSEESMFFPHDLCIVLEEFYDVVFEI